MQIKSLWSSTLWSDCLHFVQGALQFWITTTRPDIISWLVWRSLALPFFLQPTPTPGEGGFGPSTGTSPRLRHQIPGGRCHVKLGNLSNLNCGAGGSDFIQVILIHGLKRPGDRSPDFWIQICSTASEQNRLKFFPCISLILLSCRVNLRHRPDEHYKSGGALHLPWLWVAQYLEHSWTFIKPVPESWVTLQAPSPKLPASMIMGPQARRISRGIHYHGTNKTRQSHSKSFIWFEICWNMLECISLLMN